MLNFSIYRLFLGLMRLVYATCRCLRVIAIVILPADSYSAGLFARNVAKILEHLVYRLISLSFILLVDFRLTIF